MSSIDRKKEDGKGGKWKRRRAEERGLEAKIGTIFPPPAPTSLPHICIRFAQYQCEIRTILPTTTPKHTLLPSLPHPSRLRRHPPPPSPPPPPRPPPIFCILATALILPASLPTRSTRSPFMNRRAQRQRPGQPPSFFPSFLSILPSSTFFLPLSLYFHASLPFFFPFFIPSFIFFPY